VDDHAHRAPSRGLIGWRNLRIMADGERIEPPAPVQVNSVPIIATGTALFFVAFVALLPFYGWLGEHGHRIWLWTSMCGWILGFVGYALMRRHRRMGRTI
jgi:hypothetical protein